MDALSEIGGPTVVPALVRMPGADDPVLSAEDGFLLSRIDGMTRVADIARIMGKSDEEVAARLLLFFDAGIVRFRGQGAASSAATSFRPSASFRRPAEEAGRKDAASEFESRPPSGNRSVMGSGSRPSLRRPAEPEEEKTRPMPRPGTAVVDDARGSRRSASGGAEATGLSSSTSIMSRPAAATERRDPPQEKTVYDHIDEALGVTLPRNWPQAPRRAADTSVRDLDISAVEWIAIDYAFRNLPELNPYSLLDVRQDADRRAIRDAWMSLSRAFHPDLWFRRDIGDCRERVDAIFKAVSKAFGTLDKPEKREALDRQLAGARAPRPEIRDDEAAARSAATVLVVKAKKAVAEKDHRQAANLLERACGLTSDPGLRIRLAAILLRFPERLDDAEHWLDEVKEVGVRSATWHRVRGTLAWRRGRTDDARSSFERALELKPDDREAREALERLRRRSVTPDGD